MVAAADVEAWDAYFYGDSQVLRNLLELRDSSQLESTERALVMRRSEQLYAGNVEISRTFDGQHLQAIHRHLFAEIYAWAGEYRTVDFSKRVVSDDPLRPYLPHQGIERWLTEMGAAVRDIPWSELDRDNMVTEISEIHTYLNYSHPFREGNGRTARIFLEHLVEETAFRLDFDRVNPKAWNEASRDSIAPSRDRQSGGPLLFEPQAAIFEQLIVMREQTAPASEANGRASRIEHLRAQQLGAADLDRELAREQDLGRGPRLGR